MAVQQIGIIGAGIGGLVAGAFLARAGHRVTVLEKAAYPGGSAGHYVRGNRTFPTGATIAYGLESGGLLQKLLEEIGAVVPATAQAHAMDVVLPDRRVSLYQDRQQWEAELAVIFHERSDAVLAFWRELSAIAERVLAVTGTRVAFPLNRIYQLGSLPRLALHRPFGLLRLAPDSLKSVEDLLRRHKLQDYAAFRSFLDAQLIDAAQTECTDAALLPSSLALDIYRNGSFAIEGGMGGLIAILMQRLADLGGTVRLGKPVTGMRREHGRWQLASRNEAYTFDKVINASGLEWTGTKLEEQEWDSGGRMGADAGWGAFRLDAIVSSAIGEDDERLLQIGGLPFAWQIVPTFAPDLLPEINGPVYVTAHASTDEDGKVVPGELLLTVSVHLPADSWIAMERSEYAVRKERLTEAIIAEIGKVLPSFRMHLLRLHTGTPKTYRRYVGKSRVGGFPLTVRNAILRPRGSLGGHPGLYLAGEQVFPGPGTLSAALSGYYAARAVLGRRP